MEREQLMKALKLAGGAVSTKEDMPALASYFFDGKWVRAYDDEVAISTRCTMPLEGGVSGKVLTTWVGACSGVDVEVLGGEGKERMLQCGRSKLSVSLLDPKDFVFEEPAEAEATLEAPLDLLEAMGHAQIYMGSDEAHPWRIGMTISVDDGKARVFTTTNVAMAYATAPVESDEAIEIVIPIRFVNLLLSMSKTQGLAALRIGKGWIEATFDDETVLFSRTLKEVNVAGYEKVLTHMYGGKPTFIPVPEGFVDVIERVGRVMSATREESATLQIKKGSMLIHTAGTTGLAALADNVQCAPEHPDVSVHFVPASSLPALKLAKEMAVVPNAILLRGQDFESFVSVSVSKSTD